MSSWQKKLRRKLHVFYWQLCNQHGSCWWLSTGARTSAGTVIIKFGSQIRMPGVSQNAGILVFSGSKLNTQEQMAAIPWMLFIFHFDLKPIRWQANTWCNDDEVLWRHMPSLGHSEIIVNQWRCILCLQAMYLPWVLVAFNVIIKGL